MEPVIYVSVLRFGVDVHRYFDVAEMTYRHYRLRESIRTLLTANALGLNMRLLVRSRMQLGAVHTGMVGAHATESASEGAVAGTSALDGKSLSHDRATLAEHLEV